MTKVITRAEVKKNRHRNSLWMIIHDEVYDVTKFVEEHPGGEDTLLDAGGTDATVAFEDVGHSEDARELLLKYKIGKLPDDEKSEIPTPVKTCSGSAQRMSAKREVSRRSSASGKSSCSDCTSVASCLAANNPPKKIEKNWRQFDAPSASDPKSKSVTSHVGPELTSKGSKTARFVVPPDKCDEGPTSTTAASKIVCDNEKSQLPKYKKKTKKGNWKWWALAVLVLGAIAAGVMVAKKKA